MKTIAHLLGIATVLLLSGCTSTSPMWDARFGDAARTVAAQQVINPDASRDTDPVAGVDGKAARGAMDEYAKSYVNPEPTPSIFTIGVGGSGGGGR